MVQHRESGRTYRVPNTLLSDTEESVVGTQWHQEAFFQLADMVREVAERRGTSWGVCTQLTLVGLKHVDGRPYNPIPDVVILAQPLARGNLASVHINDVGAPLFIAEVVSESTWVQDVGEKRGAYEALGVPEYLVFDPEGVFLRERVQAWRLVGGVYRRWLPDRAGWWQSEVLEVGIARGHPLLRLRDRDGKELALSGLARQQRDAEQQRRQEAEVQRDAEQQRRQEAEAQRDAEQQRRQEAEAQRDTEQQRRRELEEWVQRLSAQLAERDSPL